MSANLKRKTKTPTRRRTRTQLQEQGDEPPAKRAAVNEHATADKHAVVDEHATVEGGEEIIESGEVYTAEIVENAPEPIAQPPTLQIKTQPIDINDAGLRNKILMTETPRVLELKDFISTTMCARYASQASIRYEHLLRGNCIDEIAKLDLKIRLNLSLFWPALADTPDLLRYLVSLGNKNMFSALVPAVLESRVNRVIVIINLFKPRLSPAEFNSELRRAYSVVNRFSPKLRPFFDAIRCDSAPNTECNDSRPVSADPEPSPTK